MDASKPSEHPPVQGGKMQGQNTKWLAMFLFKCRNFKLNTVQFKEKSRIRTPEHSVRFIPHAVS